MFGFLFLRRRHLVSVCRRVKKSSAKRSPPRHTHIHTHTYAPYARAAGTQVKFDFVWFFCCLSSAKLDDSLDNHPTQPNPTRHPARKLKNSNAKKKKTAAAATNTHTHTHRHTRGSRHSSVVCWWVFENGFSLKVCVSRPDSKTITKE